MVLLVGLLKKTIREELLVVFFSLVISQNEQEFHYPSLLDSALMFLKILIIRLPLTS